jgi:molybdate transport system substrate-binding protein
MKNSLNLWLLAVVVLAIGLVSCSRQAASPPPKLRLYCAAGVKAAMDELVAEFTRSTGVQIETEYAGSGTLLSRIKLVRQGDLFLPAESDYVEMARKDGLVTSQRTVTYVWPVILVAKGNPKNIRSLEDLARPGLRVGLGNPDACQIGRASVELLAKNKLDAAAVNANVVVKTGTVTELGLQVKTGHIDAAIVYDAVARQFADSADMVPIPPSQNVPSHYVVAVLSVTKNAELAGRFCDWLATPAARQILVKQGYNVDAVSEGTMPASAPEVPAATGRSGSPS